MVLKSMLIYPSQMSVPLMAKYGVPPPPKGMLDVCLDRIDNLKVGGGLV
jgi:hypothetical protein